jgi:two-component system LytT family response regulator
MKISSIIIEHEAVASGFLKKCLHSEFPDIIVEGEVSNYFQACELIRKLNPELVFLDMNALNKIRSLESEFVFETVYISSHTEDAIWALRQNACGFILKPLNVGDIVSSVASVISKLSEKAARQVNSVSRDNSLPHTQLIGIPTMEGIEFLSVQEIIRFEGLQKCTRTISTRKKDLISSYNIGEFRKMLEEYGFYACHKSHLINLMHVRKITKEGFVFLIDNVGVPLARRKRLEFLQLLKHL